MDYAKRSFLFEIVNKKNRSKAVESFTLIIPPEEESVEEPQRVSYTKTFGGVFVDDYGEDVKKIILSGHTGNSKLKQTFYTESASRVPTEMNGQNAFFHFRNRIMRYKSGKLKNYENYEILLYDLSLIPEAFRKGDFKRLLSIITLDSYVVSLDNFKMKRNKDKPLYFNYSIEMTTLRKLGDPIRVPTPVKTENPFNLVESIRKGLNAIKTVYGKIVAIKNKIESCIEFVGQLEDQLVAFYDQTVDILQYPSSLAKQALGLVRDIHNDIQNLGSSDSDPLVDPSTLEEASEEAEITTEVYMKTIISIQEMLQASATLVTIGKEPNSYENSIATRVSYDEETANNGIKRFENLTDLESEIFSITSEVNTSEEEIITAYGFEIVTITEETTLEDLALEYYGEPSYQEVIAEYNNLDGVDDLTVGNTIKVPVISPFIATSDNRIYTEYIEDVYGVDIKLDDNNHPVVGESGDFLTISDQQNVGQAINLRLNEYLGARLRLTVYGLKLNIGPSAGGSIIYILANINDTVMQDPRITEIENILINGDGDRLQISFDSYTIKRGEVLPFHNTI